MSTLRGLVDPDNQEYKAFREQKELKLKLEAYESETPKKSIQSRISNSARTHVNLGSNLINKVRECKTRQKQAKVIKEFSIAEPVVWERLSKDVRFMNALNLEKIREESMIDNGVRGLAASRDKAVNAYSYDRLAKEEAKERQKFKQPDIGRRISG